MRVAPPERWPSHASTAVIGWLLSRHPRELQKSPDICVVSINNETIDWRGAVSPLTENMVTEMKLETKRASARLIALTAAFVAASFLEAMDGLAFDATQNPHPTNFGFEVLNADYATSANKAMTLDPSGIPNCGPDEALTDTGNGFTCMTPTQGVGGPPGPPGPPGAAGSTLQSGDTCGIVNFWAIGGCNLFLGILGGASNPNYAARLLSVA